MKCNHCKEKIPRKEAKCSKCGKNIDEGHWSWKVYRILSIMVFWVNLQLNFCGGILMGWVGARGFPYEILRGHEILSDLFIFSETACLCIQAGGFLVHIFTGAITLYALYERKWNIFVFLSSAATSLIYGYNLAYVIIYSILGEYPSIGIISSAVVFGFNFIMFCVALAGARRIKKRKRIYRKKVKQMIGKDDRNLINCENCGADLPDGTSVCPVCGKEITALDIDVPDNLAAWCAALSFRLNGARRRIGEDPLYIGGGKSRMEDILIPEMYNHDDYNLPGELSKSYMFEFAGRAMIWTLVVCGMILTVVFSDDGGVKWIDQVGGNVYLPVYLISVIACVVVLISTSIMNKHIVKAINNKEWDRKIPAKLLTSLGIRMGLALVLVFFMLFLDFRVVLTIPLLVYICVTQIALVILSRLVKRRIEMFQKYDDKMINSRTVTSKKYKNRRYMNMD